MTGVFDNVSFDSTPKGQKAKVPQIHLTMSSFKAVEMLSEMRGINSNVSAVINEQAENLVYALYTEFKAKKEGKQ